MSNNKQSSLTELYNKMMQYVPIEYHYLVKEEIPLEQYEAMHEKETINFAQTWAAPSVTKEHLEYFYNETFKNEKQ